MNDDPNQLRTLTEIVRDAVSQKERDSSKKLMYFIKRSLSQVGLTGECEESEILIRAYIRVREKIMAGTQVEDYLAYVSRFCYLIILEESRRRNSRSRLSQKLMFLANAQDVDREPSYSEAFSDQLIKSLWESFASLSERDKKILKLRIVIGLPWQEIAVLMVEQGEESYFHKGIEAKLRKQGERALSKLRNKLSSVDES
ncbi:MAG: hypothetical protein ACFCVB_14420 [Nodosilinea sp.]